MRPSNKTRRIEAGSYDVVGKEKSNPPRTLAGSLCFISRAVRARSGVHSAALRRDRRRYKTTALYTRNDRNETRHDYVVNISTVI